MKIQIFIISLVMSFIVGCGGTSDSAQNPIVEEEGELQELSSIYKDSIVNKVNNVNFKNLMEETNELSKENFVVYYKRMSNLRFVSIPDLNMTFDLKKKEKNNKQEKNINKHTRVIYENIWSRKDEYTCHSGGTVSKEVELFPRDHFEADTYKTGDDTSYDYNKCDMDGVTYDGKVEYSVGTSNSGVNDIHFDYTFGATPLGTFDSVFRHLSIETETQKVILNGAIRYDAISQHTPEPNSALTRLTKKYVTVGDFVVTVYDKNTGETIKLIYNGTLDKVTYSDTNEIGNTDASVIDLGIIGKFTYRRTSDYTLRIERDEEMVTLKMNDNLSGTIDNDGQMETPRSIGYDYSNSSSMKTSEHTITSAYLADGTMRYVLDLNSDITPDATKTESTLKLDLPLSDVDLMGGTIVIGFDTCPPTNRVRAYLEELGVSYTYINIHESQEKRYLLEWFNVTGVPYVGINGRYFGAAAFKKGNWAVILKREGEAISDADIKDAYEKKNMLRSAAIWYQKSFDNLKTKEKYTAFAVANDLPYTYTGYSAWDFSTADKAKEHAFKKCEERRKKREGTNREIKSKCRLYSVDGVIQPKSVVKEIP